MIYFSLAIMELTLSTMQLQAARSARRIERSRTEKWIVYAHAHQFTVHERVATRQTRPSFSCNFAFFSYREHGIRLCACIKNHNNVGLNV